ncbi:unnamed protein product [Rotaria sp. Silwood1]|nr:unnamed protein product [Rotaria sp. Silwood1]
MMIDMTLKQMELQQASQHQEIILSNVDNLSSLSSISLNNEEKVPTNVNATVPIAATITLELKIENNSNSTRIIENSILLKTNLIEKNSNVLFVLVYTFLYLITLIEDVELTNVAIEHLYSLLSYNQTNRIFTYLSTKIRRRTFGGTIVNLNLSTVMTPSLSSTVSIDKLIELDVKRMKELSPVVYSKESSLKTPKLISLLSSILASMTGTATSRKIKPSYYNKKTKYKRDSNSIMKEKSEKQQLSNITEDTLGGQLKFGLAKYLALEFTVVKHFVDCIDCIDRIRFLSRLMIGSLKHAAITRNKGRIICHRISVVASQLITDYILYISTSFANQSKTSVIHLSLLFHSFILCQLWTMYCEQVNYGYDRESFVEIMNFWTRIRSDILRLLSYSKVISILTKWLNRLQFTIGQIETETNFDLYGSTMQRVLTDRNFLSDWTRETIEKVDNYFRSKYSVGENGSRINDKKLWSDEYLLHLTKYK